MMAEKLTIENIRNSAAQEMAQGQAELLVKLQKLSSIELIKVDPKIIARLTKDQRMALFCTLGNYQTRKQDTPARTHKTSRQLRKRSPWKLISPVLRGPLLGITAGVVIAFTGIFHDTLISKAERLLIQPPPLSSHARSWPACTRLSLQTDNCLYRAQRGLSWNDASAHLGMDISELRRVNSHFSPLQSHLAQGDLLIVWRGLTPIQEKLNVK